MLDKQQLEQAIPTVLTELEARREENHDVSSYIYAETLAARVMLDDESTLRKHRIKRNLFRYVGIKLSEYPNVSRYARSKPFIGALRSLVRLGAIETEYQQIHGLPIYREAFLTPDLEDDIEVS